MFTLLFFFVATGAGIVGGALSGLVLGGKELGLELAAMMGAFYGITAALPGAVLVALYLFVSAH